MVLPLYLALTAAEISSVSSVPERCAFMACHFSPYTEGISNIPVSLPNGAMLILNDRFPCQGHSADLVANQISEAALRLGCESVLLDFQRPPDPESMSIVSRILATLSCPVAVTEAFAADLNCPVFLSPAPLHLPLSDYLAPWQGWEIWLEAALCQEEILVTDKGMTQHTVFPTELITGGFYEDALRCCYRTEIHDDTIRFTLYDTPESLEQKLELSASLGVARAVGLWQELGNSFKKIKAAHLTVSGFEHKIKRDV